MMAGILRFISNFIVLGIGHLIVSSSKRLTDWCNKPRRGLYSKEEKVDANSVKMVIGFTLYLVLGIGIWVLWVNRLRLGG